MGGRGSKPRPPPPPPPRPIIEFYYKYFDVPADGDRRIRDLNAEQDRKIARRNQLERELTVIIDKLASEKRDMYYWLDLKTKRQKEINALNKEITDLNTQIRDLQSKIAGASTTYEIATQQANTARSATDNLTAKVVDAKENHFDATNIYYNVINDQNDYLIDKYNDKKSDFIKGDVLSSEVTDKESFYSYVNYILSICYFVLVAILVYVLVFVSTKMSLVIRIILIIIAILYPFIIMLIEYYAYDLIVYLYKIAIAEPYKKPTY